MPAPPKQNERTIFLKEEGKGKVNYYFDDDRDQEIPYNVTLYWKKDGKERAIGTVLTLSDNVFYLENGPDETGNYLFDSNGGSTDFIKDLKNKIYIKQSELAGGKKKKAKKTKKAKKSKKTKKTQKKSIRRRR